MGTITALRSLSFSKACEFMVLLRFFFFDRVGKMGWGWGNNVISLTIGFVCGIVVTWKNETRCGQSTAEL